MSTPDGLFKALVASMTREQLAQFRAALAAVVSALDAGQASEASEASEVSE